MMNEEALESLVGRRIAAARYDERHHVEIMLDDGRVAQFYGGGYDGLWTEVFVEIASPEQSEDG